MKNDTIIIYSSKTGFTKRYAQWISEALSCECVEVEKAGKLDFSSYTTIIFGGWVLGGTLMKADWVKNHLEQWKNKRIAAFSVGGSRMEDIRVDAILEASFNLEERDKITMFYCPGGINYEKMGLMFKFMLKMIYKSLKAKEGKTEEEKNRVEMLAKSSDISDKKYIEPIVAWAKQY